MPSGYHLLRCQEVKQSSIPHKKVDLLLLLQGGLGNQLLQLVLAETLAQSMGRRLVASRVLLTSRTRQLRGITYRSLSPLVMGRLGIIPVPWHRHIANRLAARIGIASRAGILTDDLLIEAAEESLRLNKLSWVRTIHSHATHPILFGGEFTNSWKTTLDSLSSYRPISPLKIAMHVRRSDYMNPLSGFALLDKTYYKAALGKVLEASTPSQTPTLIHTFSDDPEWCRNHLQDPRWQLKISRGTPEQDLASMAHAEILITGNSSLSAIAGHLAELRNPSTMVFTPQHWLLNPDNGRLGDLRKATWQTVIS